YVTNSDSHSLAKIAREYQKFKLASPSFNEVKKALGQEDGRSIEANYGMSPKLGKYYTTVCQKCFTELSYTTEICPHCRSKKIIPGVYDRIQALQDATSFPSNRPSYFYQVPLEYLPGIGPRSEEHTSELQSRFDLVFTLFPYTTLFRSGKYYTTVCQKCFTELSYTTEICPHCRSKKIIPGVYDRIQALQDATSFPSNRPSYFYQVPLEYLPGIGP